MADPRYKTSRWKRLRQRILERDGHECQIQAPGCEGRATEVDHVIPRIQFDSEGRGDLFWEGDNLRAACKPCNVGRVQRHKSRDGWRSAETRILLIYGPPASGVSARARGEAGEGVTLIDYGSLIEMCGGDSRTARRLRSQLLNRLRRGSLTTPRAVVTATGQDAPLKYPHHQAILHDPRGEYRDAGPFEPASVGASRDW